MAKTTINIDTKQIDHLAKELKGFEKEVAKATARALNRTVDHVFTQIGRIVPKEYGVKSSDVKKSLKKNKINENNLTASVSSKGHVLSLAHFSYTPKMPSRKDVMANIKKANGKVLVKNGFVAPTGAKKEDKTQYNVFHRIGKTKVPKQGIYKGKTYKRGPKKGQPYEREIIDPIRTVSIPQMITNEKVAQEIEKSAQDMLEKRLEHEITQIMTTMDKSIKGK